MKSITVFCGVMLAASGLAQSGTPLTLEQALSLAQTSSPALRAAGMNTLAAEKGVDAAGIWKNPDLNFMAENVGGDLDLYDEGQYTLGISQEFLRGGKRGAERQVASQSVIIATQGAAEAELNLCIQVRRAFMELLARQEIGKVRGEQLELGRAFVEVARRRLDAGAGSELEVVQAELSLEEIVIAQTCCYGDLAAARSKLASLIGMPPDQLPELSGSYYEIGSMDHLNVDYSDPALRRIDAEAGLIEARAEQARAGDVSDITLGAGYRYEAFGDVSTWVFSASMPLSFTRRGRAEHEAGMLHADAVRLEREEVRRRLLQELDTGRELHKGAAMEAELTRDRLLPKAEEAYTLSRAGYEAGRFSWLELIAAQQHLADVRVRYIEALLAVHQIEAGLSRFDKKGFRK